MRKLILTLGLITLSLIGCVGTSEYLNREETAEVTASGYGDSWETSQKHAMKEAVSIAFGTRVHTEQQTKDRFLTKNEVNVTDIEPSSVVKTYQVLEKSKQAGL